MGRVMTALDGTLLPLDVLAAVAPQIWETMLGLPLHAGATEDDVFAEVASMTGLVTISGPWSGAVLLQCSATAARRFAAAMFAADDADELPEDEVRDAMAELTNMAGGGVKNLLPDLATLGIPTVTAGVGYRINVPRTVVLHRFGYHHEDEQVLVTVRQAR